jgi:hypothetical protein
MNLTADQYRLIQFAGPIVAVVLVGVWFTWQEYRDHNKG